MDTTSTGVGAATHRAIDIGIDVGSTTVKIVAMDHDSRELLMSSYVRHHARQVECILNLLEEARELLASANVHGAITGSGALGIAKTVGLPYVQEVVANAIAVRTFYGDARTAIELGGQDAKMVFFTKDDETGDLSVSDMRMNGSCAGGTGAFLDEVANLLKIEPEQFNDLACEGTTVYDISGRCGVFAKTDIQPLLNQGARKTDIALSTFHAVAKQTIGGLAQGLDIHAPVIFEGGPLTFNPRLISVFSERLNLAEDEIIIPERAETIVACGAALSTQELYKDEPAFDVDAAIETLRAYDPQEAAKSDPVPPFFASEEERREFEERTKLPDEHEHEPHPGDTVNAYLGIDSGSTTTKFALIDEDENLVDSFYSNNEGNPLDVAKQALIDLRNRYERSGVTLNILGLGTTGYGENLFNKAFHADYHVVETVAHAHAVGKYVPDASFILDIGGQDMKAIWVNDGVITDIVVNEACSSGCGSFLQNLAGSLGIKVQDIAERAFASDSPAQLGSRCTVFMTSSIVTEQKNGKTPNDIMAGLCRSIIENVFTKVIRMSNVDRLGKRIVVQGGTFRNDAVLRALEQYIGKPVSRAPYPGLMGAIGCALLTKQQMERNARAAQPQQAGASAVSPVPSTTTQSHQVGAAASSAAYATSTVTQSQQASDPSASASFTPSAATQAPLHANSIERDIETHIASTFIGLDAMDDFSYTQTANLVCPFCANHCNRSIVEFSDGTSWISGNRCSRGEIVGNPKDQAVREQLRIASQEKAAVPDMFEERKKLLFQDWPCEPVAPDNGIRIGLPRVLALWDNAPFWTTFLRALGYTPVLSHQSTRKMYEEGLPAVASDTVCFPAKLVHGHLRDLHRKHVDRIFMPTITTVASENTQKTSESMCAVVKGYPMVIRNSDNTERRFDIPFDNPLFHWYTDKDRDRQLCEYMGHAFGIEHSLTRKAIAQADAAQKAYRKELVERGRKIIDDVTAEGRYAVILASRPYHNDTIVNHDLPSFFTDQGIPVLTPDSVPGMDEVDLSRSRLDIVNNFHARMLSTAVLAAENPHLEYVQLVSFGCGHDAYLSDEIIRLMKEVSDSAPLILKIDESDAQGPLQIRVRSFIETIEMRRMNMTEEPHVIHAQLEDPYPVKFTDEDAKTKTVLVPNTSHAFCRLMAAVFTKQGLNAVPLEIGREEAIRLGKKYVHNDICFPAQIVIGEALAALESGQYDPDTTAVGMAKYVGDCRLTHYSALLRKALDDAGYSQVPIITNDDVDSHDMHPGFKMNTVSAIRTAFGLPMIDIYEELLRKMRPYELEKGSAQRAFDKAMDYLIEGMLKRGIGGAASGFKKGIQELCAVKYDRSHPRPTVLIVGEYLLNFHPGANNDIEAYLESNGLEVIEARMTDVIRKTYFYKRAQVHEYKVTQPTGAKIFGELANQAFERAHDLADHIAKAHPLYTRAARMEDIVEASDPIIHHTFDAGEGVLIPAEILHHAANGCRAFVILQPFGCLPNHVVGRGIAKRLKELYPDAQILPLDYDPDMSQANLENRLQMLIINALRAGNAEPMSPEDAPKAASDPVLA